MSIDFLVTSLIVVMSPGTGVLYTLAAGLSRRSGCTLGILPQMAAAIMGLTALLHTRTFAGAFVALGAKLALADR